MPLSVKDGMGAWISDFKKSDAPQFKGKSEKERREMAIAAYMDAKRGRQNESVEENVGAAATEAVKYYGNPNADDEKRNAARRRRLAKDQRNSYTGDNFYAKPKKESVEENNSAPRTAAHRRAQMGSRYSDLQPPFDPDPKKPQAKNSDKTTTSPMSRAKQLAKMARDRNMKKEDTQLEEMYASTTEPHKDGHRPKVVKTHSNGKTTMSYLGQHVYKSKEHARNAADHIANGMRKGRASDSYIDDFARRHHKEHGMKEAYRPPTQAEIDADKRKENRGKSRPSMTAKSATRNVYKNMMGGLKKESTQIDELDSKTYRSYSDKANKELMRTDISPDKRSKRALGKATADMKKYGDKRTLKQRIRNEEVELEEAHAYSKAADALRAYANKSGGIDKKDFHTAAKHLDNIGKAGLMQKGQHLAKMNAHFKGLDTDVRDRIHMTLKQHGVMEAVQVDELKKSTLGNYVKVAAKDAASKAYGAASAAKDNRPDQAGKDFSKSMKRLRGIDTATKKLSKEEVEEAVNEVTLEPHVANTKYGRAYTKAKQLTDKANKSGKTDHIFDAIRAHKEAIKHAKGSTNKNAHAGHVRDLSSKLAMSEDVDVEFDARRAMSKDKDMMDEAKSFDQKFTDHLKFATSKSPAVQAYLKKRAADRDAMNKKNDPNAAKKGYALTATPPERAYMKARKHGMSTGQARDALSQKAVQKKKMSGKLPG